MTARTGSRSTGVSVVTAAVIALAIAAAVFVASRWAANTYDVPIDGYTIADGGSLLVIAINTYQSAEIVTTRVEEATDRVTITVRAQKDPQTFDFSATRSVEVRLRQALGERPVFDGVTGRAVPRS